ncbi:hypothetical protein LTR20_007366 [Exophiala xenobiotica]|nr:hypothetical protein LTS06_008040 [Exophiala xenobiotica]KAK5283502.1 hypothetical protein LTR40_001645 [Exophiala xenobiotica]KAK5401229.1 hypothetical protein LTR79_001748 [Exophiala xenobiotica]KAK5460059.1 hypothetical protein LTR20_007366 [Exophiala xenobiotica]KAK5488998.1 hypothetical protein LTR26_004314 [Exophiala xenobiotica]
MAKGDKALRGQPETITTTHRFDPDPSRDRIIEFQGRYLQIYNEKEHVEKTLKEDVQNATDFEVPKDYTTYVRGVATLCFKELAR